MRVSSLFGLIVSMSLVTGAATPVLAQSPDTGTRQSMIENAAAEKAKTLKPYDVTLGEKVIAKIEKRFTGGLFRWHPFLEPAYRGGGFAAGLGYMFHTRRLQHVRRAR